MVNYFLGLSGGLEHSPGATGSRRETRSNQSLRQMIQVASGSRRMAQGQGRRQRLRRLHLRRHQGNEGVVGWALGGAGTVQTLSPPRPLPGRKS